MSGNKRPTRLTGSRNKKIGEDRSPPRLANGANRYGTMTGPLDLIFPLNCALLCQSNVPETLR